MELGAAIRGRRSIRKFRPDAVPRGVVEEILEGGRAAFEMRRLKYGF